MEGDKIRIRKIIRWTSINSKNLQKIKWQKLKKYGEDNKEFINIRENKFDLSALLMKNIKVDIEGRVLITKSDEWNDEKEWDELYNQTKE